MKRELLLWGTILTELFDVGKIPNLDDIALRQILIIFFSSNIGTAALSFDIVPFHPYDTSFAIVNNEPSRKKREHWVMIVNFKMQLYSADSLGGSKFLQQ